MRKYEAMVIIDPRLGEAAIQQAVERFTRLIGSKGELTKVDTWGRRKLAYEINHVPDGHYVVAYFRGEPPLVDDLDRLFDLSEEYIRAKVVRVPD